MTVKAATLESVIKDMLTENTGTHFLDSGGAYGRHWQENQKRDVASGPAAWIDWDYDGPDVTLNLYHWLLEQLGEYREGLTKDLHRFGDSEEMEDESWPETVAAWLEQRSMTIEMGDNSYNGESCLSQVIQWWGWYEDNVPLVALQIHGGCDVRGGYTKPCIFEAGDELFLHRVAWASIYCPHCHASWYTNDAWHFYNDEDLPGFRTGSEPIPIIFEEDITEEHKAKIKRYKENRATVDQPTLCERGEIALLGFVRVLEDIVLDSDDWKTVTPNRKGLCPICGEGILGA